MIQPYTRLKVADNAGAKQIMCFRVPRGGKKQVARLGETIIASVKIAVPHSNVKKKSIVKAVIVRQRAPYHRSDGSVIKFDDNAAVLINDDKTPVGSRIIGPVARELKNNGFNKIISLAPEVV